MNEKGHSPLTVRCWFLLLRGPVVLSRNELCFVILTEILISEWAHDRNGNTTVAYFHGWWNYRRWHKGQNEGMQTEENRIILEEVNNIVWLNRVNLYINDVIWYNFQLESHFVHICICLQQGNIILSLIHLRTYWEKNWNGQTEWLCLVMVLNVL